LLFAGTEFGAFASLDGGSHWEKLGNELPTVAVDDLTIQPRDHALVAATHGRSLYVLDNISSLEAATKSNLDAALFLCPMAPAVEFIPAGGGWFGSGREYHSENAPSGVEILFWMQTLADAPPSIKITDSAGKSVANLVGARFPGVQSIRWDLRTGPPPARNFGGGPPAAGPRFVKPGEYTVTVAVGKVKATSKVLVTGPAALSVPEPDTTSSR
ncbi:MAG TPA: hypothetical protein VGS41_05170, partial [Chthonomonadales bacterium]|nr:hypothetical protein [Chthonomonadales bacterium]